jgi:hypothetical protein
MSHWHLRHEFALGFCIFYERIQGRDSLDHASAPWPSGAERFCTEEETAVELLVSHMQVLTFKPICSCEPAEPLTWGLLAVFCPFISLEK